jgi:hypothetical protein
MSFVFISTFLIFTGFLFYYASKSQPLSFDLDQLPDFVKQLAKEAYQEGRTVMSPNDKGQIESYTEAKWQDLDMIKINSIWMQEINRLKCLTQSQH